MPNVLAIFGDGPFAARTKAAGESLSGSASPQDQLSRDRGLSDQHMQDRRTADDGLLQSKAGKAAVGSLPRAYTSLRTTPDVVFQGVNQDVGLDEPYPAIVCLFIWFALALPAWFVIIKTVRILTG